MQHLRLQGEHHRSIGRPQLVAVCSSDANDDACRYSLTRDGWVRKEQDSVEGPSKLVVCWELQLSQALDMEDPDLPSTTDNHGWFGLIRMSRETNAAAAADEHLVALSHSGAIASIVNGHAELVGEFENGIVTATWSPNREVLALITQVTEDEENTTTANSRCVVLTMNHHFDILEEKTIEAIAPTEASTTSLCWSPASVTPRQIAICSVDRIVEESPKNTTSRKVRFYSAETLELAAMGRNEDGSGALAPNLHGTSMAWGEATGLLSSIQQKGKRTTQVAFFEPNGLRHREFPLRETDLLDVVSMAWNNPMGDLLAVTLRCKSPSNDSVVAKVQLWHRSNYHWYLKYELQYQDEIGGVRFDYNYPYRLYVLRSSEWHEYSFLWEDSVGCGAMAFAVDGAILNMTNFDQCFIPPPMYMNSLTLEASICEIAFSRNFGSGGGGGIAVLADGRCSFLSYDASSKSLKAQEASSLSNDDSVKVRWPVVLTHANGHLMLLQVVSSSNPFQDELVLSHVNISESGATIVPVGRLSLEGRCLCVMPWEDSDAGALLEFDDGTLWEFELGEDHLSVGSVVPSSLLPLMEPCPWMAAIKNPSLFGANHRERLIVAKSNENRFYCQDLLLADSIASFIISIANGYLCYVTAETRCVARFLPLVDLCSFDPLLGADENHLLQGYEPRLVEEGAKLINVLSAKPAMVLQMPRGNIEVNYPRALVLRHVMLQIKTGEYGRAYETMRRQKVDLNLIVDMDPNRFLNECGFAPFLEQVVNIDHLNLFISNLQNWDSTAEQIPVPHWIRNGGGDSRTFDFSTKINQVCKKMREEMLDAQLKGCTQDGRKISSDHFLLPILSTFAKQDPPRLGDAIELIRSNAENHGTSDAQNPTSRLLSKETQDSIKYLAFLADYEMLFNTALGLYDYDMARAIARNSQMDPKMYLPLIRRYKELPSFLGRYEVDIKLERFDAALRNLAESFNRSEHIDKEVDGQSIPNGFGACMELVENHSLHRLGLELFTEARQRHQILVSLGNHALKEKQYELALYVFLSTGESEEDKRRCIEAARLAKDWRTLFCLSDKAEHEALASEVADTLAASAEGSLSKTKLLQDAATILLDYGHDIEKAAGLLASAKLWEEAKRVALMDSDSSITDYVTESAVSYAYICLEDFHERADAFSTASEQYTKSIGLRNDAKQNGDEEMMIDDTADQGSLFSVASNASMMSTRSTNSTASSASLSSVISIKSNSSFSVTRESRHKSKFNSKPDKKKKQKKKQKKRVVPGSDEDLRALVSSLKGNLIDDNYRQHVNDTIAFLLKSNEASSARALLNGYQNFSRRVDVMREAGIQQRRDLRSKIAQDCWYEPQGWEHPTEAEVMAMIVPSLDDSLCTFFSSIPPSIPDPNLQQQ